MMSKSVISWGHFGGKFCIVSDNVDDRLVHDDDITENIPILFVSGRIMFSFNHVWLNSNASLFRTTLL